LKILGIYFFNIVRRENVMKLRIKMIILAAVACFAFAIAGCGEKGTAEKAGKEVDKAAESAKEAIHDATK
jgi:predicted small lipoprotein YifL